MSVRRSISVAEQRVCHNLAALVCCRRSVRVVNPIGEQESFAYSSTPKMKAGLNVAPKPSEFYDGYTDDFGVFKEGPPTTLRLEYVRSPEHLKSDDIYHQYLWSPFQVGPDMLTYTPLYYDYRGFNSRDRWGHRFGSAPGDRVTSHYNKQENCTSDPRWLLNYSPQRHIPKWLACVVNDQRRHRMIGFFLYANGVYCAELLTFKQLPRLTYNRPFQGCIPTIGQRITLAEVTYGKEVSVLETYPGYGGSVARGPGASAVILRGSDPTLIPVLMPSKEVRLFEPTCEATFGRCAGVMHRYTRIYGHGNVKDLRPKRPRARCKAMRVSQHPAGGGNGFKYNMVLRLDWKIHPFMKVKTKYWLSGYILRGRQYQRKASVADIKAKVHNLKDRDPVYR